MHRAIIALFVLRALSFKGGVLLLLYISSVVVRDNSFLFLRMEVSPYRNRDVALFELHVSVSL